MCWYLLGFGQSDITVCGTRQQNASKIVISVHQNVLMHAIVDVHNFYMEDIFLLVYHFTLHCVRGSYDCKLGINKTKQNKGK